MSDNNDFLSQYGQNRPGGPEKPGKPGKPDKPGKPEKPGKAEIVVRDAPLPSFKYEQKSDFVPPERRDTAPPPPPSRRGLIIGVAAGALALIVVVLAVVLLLGRGVEMIDLTGMKLTEAQLWAEGKGVKLQSTEEYNDEHAEGLVFGQSVSQGDRVKKDDFVSVKVSKGHDLSVTVEMPDIKSMTMAEVQAWADANFMTKVRITTEFSDTVPINRVISFQINDDRVTGDVVRRDSPVYVVVSKGPEDEAALQVTVPDFKTMALPECYTFASENGLTLIVENQYDDYISAGSIISQSVKAQQKVTKGSEITLVVSLGKKITVPSFSGYSKEAASAKAAELGIPVTVTERYSGSSAGAFISQSIAAGSVYQRGDILELKYSLGNKIAVASYVGQTLDALQAWAQGLNAQGAAIGVNVTYTKSNSPAGTILSQSPANKSIGYRDNIAVTVSSGKVVYVPDFVGDGGNYNAVITREDAIAMCEKVGLIPVFVKGSNSGRLPGEVWKQDLPAGSETTEGMKITLTYVDSKPLDPPGVPNFIGLSRSNANSMHGNILRITFVEGDTYAGDGSDVVVAQSLPVNSTVAKGTEIVLTLDQLL